MIKRLMVKPRDGGLEADPCGSAIWIVVGRRLRHRRTQLGFDIDHVATNAGISPSVYEGYELGVHQTPVLLLAQIADLFGVPVVWFFEDVGFDAEAVARSDSPAVYTVATVEQRIQALADSFRKLDLEGQQHLLAISGALSGTSGKGVRN